MAKMNYKQIEHAQNRLGSIKHKLEGASPSKPSYPNADTIATELAGGRRITTLALQRAAEAYAVTKQRNRYHDPNFLDCLSEQMHDREYSKQYAEYQKKKKSYDARCLKVEVKFTAVNDAIVLGDCDRAIELIKEFSDLEV